VNEKITDAKGVRPPVSLSFTALGSDDPFTLDALEVRGDIFMGAGSTISTEAGGNVSFKGGTVTLLGSVIAPGGEISVAGAGSLPLTASQRQATTQVFATVHIGAAARLSTAGITQLVPDDFGRRAGKVYDGGKISVSGNILAESGAVLDVFREEPLPPGHRFWTTPGLIITAHIAARSYPRDIGALFLDNYRRHATGQPLRHLVDPGRAY